MARSSADADRRREPGGSRGCYPGCAQPGPKPGSGAACLLAGLPGEGEAAPRAGGAGRCCPEAREGSEEAAGSPPPDGVPPGVAERFGERPTAPLGAAGEPGPGDLGPCPGVGGRGHRVTGAGWLAVAVSSPECSGLHACSRCPGRRGGEEQAARLDVNLSWATLVRT